jgi:hypothetical protein
LPDLTGGLVAAPVLPNLSVTLPSLGELPTALVPEVAAPSKRKPAVAIVKPVLPIATNPLDSATRASLLVVCAVAWALLTHLGITRLRRTT